MSPHSTNNRPHREQLVAVRSRLAAPNGSEFELNLHLQHFADEQPDFVKIHGSRFEITHRYGRSVALTAKRIGTKNAVSIAC